MEITERDQNTRIFSSRADKFVKVVVQREGHEAQHCMFARRTAPSCYEASWTMKPEDLTANYTFQVTNLMPLYQRFLHYILE